VLNGEGIKPQAAFRHIRRIACLNLLLCAVVDTLSRASLTGWGRHQQALE